MATLVPGAVKEFMDAGAFESLVFTSLPNEEQITLRDAYWKHLNIVLRRLDIAGPGERLQLTNSEIAECTGVNEEDLRAVWEEVARCMKLPESSYSLLL